MNTKISKREQEVLHLIAHEYTTNEIASELYISSHTVITHRKNLLSKMGVKNVAGLVRRGFEMGMIRANVSIVLFFLMSSFSLHSQTIFVDADASTGGNGRTWGTAYKYLQDALTEARTLGRSLEIWVAEGTYYPDDNEAGNFTNDDQNAAFTMINNVAILGGFKGNETSPDKRDWATNICVLSGDIQQNTSNQAYNVINNTMTSATALNNSAVLDGFTITQGRHSTSAATFGGGAMINDYASVVVRNCIFSDNRASNTGGGAIYNDRSDPVFENCLFFDNDSFFNSGQVMINSRSNVSISNCTLADNDIGSGDHVIYNISNAQVTIMNSILWNGDNEILDVGTAATSVNYSIVDGGFAGTGNINADPLFQNSGSNNYNLTECSPAIDNGTVSGVSLNLDLNHDDRIFNGLIDIGVYEYGVIEIIYVDADQLFNNHFGSSWVHAFEHVQDALNAIPPCNRSQKQIWVAEGTYYPDEGPGITNDDRDTSFVMLNNVALYGGFSGNESSTTQRDWSNNLTILSGDIDQNDASGDTTSNSYCIIKNDYDVNDPLGTSALLDGFVISAAYEGFGGRGGGMHNSYASPRVRNCMFKNNHSSAFGGAIYAEYSESIIENTSFVQNSAPSQGGAVLAGPFANLTFDECDFSQNDSYLNNAANGIFTGKGGALYVVSSLDSVVVKKSNFYRNRSFFEGGGIFTTGYLKMENCEVSHNSAREAGGLYSQADSLVVLSSSFDSNHSNTPLNGLLSTSVHGGGGIYLISGKATFVDTDFTGNTTTLQGGAILSEKSSPTFYNCTFQNNKALLLNANQVNLQKGGAIYMDVEGNLGLHRCSLIGNEAVDGGGGILLADICNLYISNTVMSDNSSFHLFFEGTNTGEIRNSTFTRTNNNAFNGDLRWNGALSFEVYNSIFYGHDILISEIGDVTMFNCIAEGGFLNGSNISDVDPLLVDPANGDFQLGTGSPAIDAGDNGYVNSTMDLLGNLRIDTVNNFVDLGAVEVQSPPAMNTCNEHLMLTGTIASGTYQASGYITCNGTIPAGANVILSAPDSVIMTNDFNVIATGTFEVNDVGCNE